jgi:hypothetical protein
MKTSIRTHRVVALAALLSAPVLHAADVTGDRLNVGTSHSLSGTAADSSIAGGQNNTIGNTTLYSLIGGGLDNTIGANCYFSGIFAGEVNTISNYVQYGFIGAGFGNELGGNYSTILGIHVNISSNAFGSFGNGYYNNMDSPYGVILNGLEQNISADADYALIGNGKFNLISRDAEYSAIVAGYSNAIGLHAEYSYIGNGEFNTNNSSWAYLGGGFGNLVVSNADYSVLVGGASNKVSGSRATIPGGDSASAANYGQLAYASGRFAAVGDAQSSKYVLRNSTSGAVTNELFLNGSSARMTLPNNSTWTFEGQVVARSSTGSSAGYKFKGVIDNNSGTTSLVYTPSYETLAEDVAGWDVVVQADDANDALVVKVTGALSTNIRWVATVQTTEVTY